MKMVRVGGIPITSNFQLRCFCRCTSLLSNSSSQRLKDFDSEGETEEFLKWLRKKAGTNISSVLSIGNSVYGRSLFASRSIEAGECILKVPYSAQLTSDKISSDIEQFINPDIGSVSRLAIVLLWEQKMGKHSEWAPYTSKLPSSGQMHNTIFWNTEELELVQTSPVYQETVDHKAQILKEFTTLEPALEHFPQVFSKILVEDFMHAYALVSSEVEV